MTVLLALGTVLAWGLWIPMAQVLPGVPQSSRTFYATLANAVFATLALVWGGGHVSLGWRGFWLPLLGGVVWTGGNYSAFKASEAIGLARAACASTPRGAYTCSRCRGRVPAPPGWPSPGSCWPASGEQ